MSFSSNAVSAMAYRRFMRALFPPGEEFVFDTTILFLAGNHDHHLWRSVQDQHFIEQIERLVQQIEGNDGVSQTKEGIESWLGMAGKGAIPQLLVDRLEQQLAETSDVSRNDPVEIAGQKAGHIKERAEAVLGRAKGVIPPLMKVTPLLEDPRLESPFLTEILRNATGCKDFSVKTAYPNLGFEVNNGSKCLVLHHGHFVESMYTAISHVTAWMSGRASIPEDVAGLEEENGGWIDYVWSDLGTAGEVAQDTVKAFQIVQDPAATRQTTTLMATRLAEFLLRRLPASGMPTVRQLTERLTRAVVGGALGRYNSSERYAFDTVLSAATLDTLRWYLNKPVRRQLVAELNPDPPWAPGFPWTFPGFPRATHKFPDEMTFVFGHTHKPFQDLLVLDGYPNPVQVFNTGGWVLDQVRQATTQGAAAVFIDDELNAGSLRLFQANPADEVMPVHVQHVRGAKTPSEPLSGVKDRHLWTRQLIDAAQSTQGEWASFSAAAYKSLALRSKIISHRFFDPHAHLTARQRRRAQ